MKTRNRGDRYFKLIIAIAGMILLAYQLLTLPSSNPNFFIVLTLMAVTGFLVQYPLKLLHNDFKFAILVGLVGGFVMGPGPASWVVAFGILAGYSFQFLYQEKRIWGWLKDGNTWLNLGFEIGAVIIPLFFTFSVFSNSANLITSLLQGAWINTVIASFLMMTINSLIQIGSYLLKSDSKPYPPLRSDLLRLITIFLLSTLFILLILAVYPDNNAAAIILFSGILILFVWLLNRIASIRTEQEQRVRELSTLYHISKTLRSTLNLDELIPVIQDQVMELFEINNFYVALYDKDSDEIWYPFAMKFGKKQFWPRRAISDRLTDRVILNGDPILLTPETQYILAPIGLPPSEETPNSWLGVPLISSNNVIGCLGVFAIEPGKYFTNADSDVLTILSGQTSVAIENALLYQQTEDRARQLETLNQLIASITATLDLSVVTAQVCESVAHVCGSQHSTIFLLDPSGEAVSLAHTYSLENDFRNSNRTFSIKNSWRTRSMQSGEPLILSDIRNEQYTGENIAQFYDNQFGSIADFPLITTEGPIGFLSVYFTEKHTFSVEEEDLLQTFARQAALAVANAHLHAQTDAALAQRVYQLTTLEAVSRELSAASHSEELFGLILKYALEMTTSSCGAVTIYNPRTHRLSIKAAVGYKYSENEFSIQDGITGRAARTLSIVNISDVKKDPDYLRLNDGELKSQLSVPIIHEKSLLGIISLESSGYNAYKESEESYVAQLANHAAIDIINAELFHETQNRLQEHATLHRVSIKLIRAKSSVLVSETIEQAIDSLIHPLDTGVYLMSGSNEFILIGGARGHLPAEINPNFDLTSHFSNETNLMILQSGDPLYSYFTNECSHCQIYVFPLEMSQKEPGFVVLHLAQEEIISQIESELIKTIIAQSAVAIQNINNLTEAMVGRDRMSAILNAIDEGIILVDINGHVLLTNDHISAFSGLKESELLGIPIFELPDSVLEQIGFDQAEISSLITGLNYLQVPTSPKTIIEIKDPKRNRIIERITSPFWGHDGKISGLLIVLRDITEEREIEQTREAITETIVHDVRSPLSAIVGSLDLLSSLLVDEDDQTVHQAILVAQRSAKRVLSLTEALLDIARLQSGQMDLMISDTNLKSLISELMIEFTVLANENNVIIQNQIEDHLPTLKADKDKLIRVITNLVDNAIKFSPQGGLVIISVNGDQEQKIEVRISDSGPGVPQDYRDKIFDRFVQVPGQKSRRRGTGLGLTFCKLVVEAHKGDIWVESNPQGGSTFIFTLPIR